MKTIEQLLQLSKNPFYKFSPEEEQVLNDFLFKKQGSDSSDSQKKSSPKSDEGTLVTATDTVKVKNVVEKTIPQVEDSGR